VKPRRSNNKRNKSKEVAFKEDKIYLEGKVIETFPGTVFGVEVIRKNNLPPLLIKAALKAMLIKRRVQVIRGDMVMLEIDPEDISSEEKYIKGVIVERKNVERPNPTLTK
jgi:translation initiation factor IF-1